MGRRIPPNRHIPANTMALNAALKQLIETKLAHTHEPQWALPIAEVRQAFRNLWTPAITGELVSIRRIEDVTIPGLDSTFRRASTRQTARSPVRSCCISMAEGT